jgi:hypothetical protein
MLIFKMNAGIDEKECNQQDGFQGKHFINSDHYSFHRL